ncbi:MAG: hypothetical protein M0004_09890 [Actinomycetota bacterium]|nr:hypothetical protein [Actinomycetota bacterium]
MSDSTNLPATTPESLRHHVEFFMPALIEAVDAVEALVSPLAFAFAQINGPLQVEGDEEFDQLMRETHTDEVAALLVRLEKCVSAITGDGAFSDEQLAGIPDSAAILRHLERS